MRDTIATDGLPDSEPFVACLDAALVMNFMTSAAVMIFGDRDAEFPRGIGVLW